MSGYLENGIWRQGWYDTRATRGEFVRQDTTFHHQITADGSSGFPAAAGRYHLYVSLACPWAHRTLIFRKLKQLEDVISVSVVHPLMGDNGWEFGSFRGATPDTVNGCRYLYEIYRRAEPTYTGRVTVPVLWDRERATIVNNDSAQIIRMLNSTFDAFTPVRTDFYPQPLRADIDAINEVVYADVNNGVYRCGFAGSQAAYDAAFDRLFARLDALDATLAGSRYLVGDTLTEADWRLFTTLVRFDAVYYVHFKCNRRRIADYPHLSRLLTELYRIDGVAETVNLDHIKTHYYGSHRFLNPSGIIPRGPELAFLE